MLEWVKLKLQGKEISLFNLDMDERTQIRLRKGKTNTRIQYLTTFMKFG